MMGSNKATRLSKEFAAEYPVLVAKVEAALGKSQHGRNIVLVIDELRRDEQSTELARLLENAMTFWDSGIRFKHEANPTDLRRQ